MIRYDGSRIFELLSLSIMRIFTRNFPNSVRDGQTLYLKPSTFEMYVCNSIFVLKLYY